MLDSLLALQSLVNDEDMGVALNSTYSYSTCCSHTSTNCCNEELQ